METEETETTMKTDDERRDEHNAHVHRTIAQQREARGYAVCIGVGAKVHAATTSVRGLNGYYHPKPSCSTAQPRYYASLLGDQSVDVTCKRCGATA